jgi:hypothetical protein
LGLFLIGDVFSFRCEYNKAFYLKQKKRHNYEVAPFFFVFKRHFPEEESGCPKNALY